MTDATTSDINSFSLSSILQVSEMEMKTQTLRVYSNSDGNVGFLDFEDGVLVNAQVWQLQGTDAAIEILRWDQIRIEVHDLRQTERKIFTPVFNILLEASLISEDDRDAAARADDRLLAGAISKAERHRFRDAHQDLIQFLKRQPRNPQGWLWCARIMGRIESVEKALRNAFKLARSDSEVLEEIKKFSFAKTKVRAGKIRHCPFCWTPLAIKAYRCVYCQAHFLIQPDFFSAARNAKRDILEAAIRRYTRITASEENVTACFYMGMAHLNLENWAKTLTQLHKTVKLAPDKAFFSNQLQLLLYHMAATKASRRQVVSTEEKESTSAAATHSVTEKNKILVVEDSPTTRKVITITLIQNGYITMEAKDGLEALSRLNEQKPDLILLDLVLPKMDGFKILSIIKSYPDFKDIPVIMLTSKDGIISKVKGKMAGSSAYLTKPFEPGKLIETVEHYL